MEKTKILALFMALVLVLCSCSGSSEAATGGKYMLATGKAGGTYYSLGTCIASVWDKYSQSTTNIATTSGSVQNIEMLLKENADFAFVQNDILHYALEGKEMYEENAQRGISVVANLYSEHAQFVVNASSDIKTIPELAGKTVAVGKYGTATEAAARQILEAYGIDMNDGIQKQNLGFGPSADALRDGKIDAFFCVAGIPTTAITDLAMGTDITVVAVEDDKFAELSEKYGFYTQQVVPADTYAGMTEDVKTVAVMATYIVDKDLPEKAVYDLTKAMFENKDAIAEAHVKGAELNAETAIEGIPAEVPLHPGAAKYYKEIGVLAE